MHDQKTINHETTHDRLFSMYLNGSRQLGTADIFEMSWLARGRNIATLSENFTTGMRHRFCPQLITSDVVLTQPQLDTNQGQEISTAAGLSLVNDAPLEVVRQDMYSSDRNTSYYFFYAMVNGERDMVALGFTFLEQSRSGVSVTCLSEYKNYFESVISTQRIRETIDLTEYVMGPDGLKSSSRSLKYNPERVAHAAFYPDFGSQMLRIFEDLMASKAGSMIFVGPPGTGKSVLIRTGLAHMRKNAIMSTDINAIMNPGLLDAFYASDATFLVLEDADQLLSKRTDGNAAASTYLNRLQGIVDDAEDCGEKKIIISTNLESLKNVDSAFLRPGRNFATIGFRKLKNLEEVNNARAAVNLPPRTGANGAVFVPQSLAEALNDSVDYLQQHAAPLTIGFTG